MNIKFINASGGGFAGLMSVDPGTTLGGLFDEADVSGDRSEYIFRVNGMQVADMGTVLNEGDKVVISRRKIAGAAKVTITNVNGIRFVHDTTVEVTCSSDADVCSPEEKFHHLTVEIWLGLNYSDPRSHRTAANTVGELFAELYSNREIAYNNPSRYEILVNNEIVTANDPVEEDDHVSICFVGE